jgi:hypothetical protein
LGFKSRALALGFVALVVFFMVDSILLFLFGNFSPPNRRSGAYALRENDSENKERRSRISANAAPERSNYYLIFFMAPPFAFFLGFKSRAVALGLVVFFMVGCLCSVVGCVVPVRQTDGFELTVFREIAESGKNLFLSVYNSLS